ncbi:LLM class flavin-dependent oxidoreductase [Pseudonocardia ailaonensis]|uniref:LLM class flavin-dependent oxidoreductase n=1 Tax=Pseudonocardia ailaonensis TaxID=367279 RepID=A0ABN2N8E5_9PSEU
MRYSLVDLAAVAPRGDKRAALDRAVASAEEAEKAGYHRIWYAEHHRTTGYASQDPAPLIALAAARTSRVRVGSGAVLLNHHSPFTVAERFLMLEAMAPGRVDLGLGRSSSGPLVDCALRRDRQAEPVDDFADQVREITGYYRHDLDSAHPFHPIDLTEGIGGTPDVWVLGSSGRTAALAGRLGVGYTFGSHINAPLTEAALDHYRRTFVPSARDPRGPRAMIALVITAADDEDLAHRLTWPARALRAAGRIRPIPTLAEAESELGAAEKARPSTLTGGVVPDQISGTAESLRQQLEPFVRRIGVGEIVVQDMLTDHELRSRSRELVAAALASVDVAAEFE